MSSSLGEDSRAMIRSAVLTDEDDVVDLISSSSLSTISSEEINEDDEDDEDEDGEDEGRSDRHTSLAERARDSLRDASRVTMTPHRHNNSGRPLRKTAAAASHAWMGEDNYRNDPVLLSTPSKSRLSTERKKRTRSSDGTPAKLTPVTKRVRMLDDTEQRKKDKAREEERTPTRRGRIEEKKRLREDIGSDVDDNVLGATSLVQPTSSDAYFVNLAPGTSRAARNQTSDNLISRTVHGGGLAARTIVSLTKHIVKQVQGGSNSDAVVAPAIVGLQSFDRFHEHWWSLLTLLHRPLLFYGVGSKRAALQRFARRMAAQSRCHVIVVRGEAGGRADEIVSELERSCGVSPVTDVDRAQRATVMNGFEARVRHLVDVLRERQSPGANSGGGKTTTKSRASIVAPAFLLLVHNIEAPTLLQEKSLRTLATLLRAPNVYLCAETSHLNAAMLAGLDGGQEAQEALQWLWVDMTTFVPPIDEIIGERGAGVGRMIGLPAVLDVRRAGAGSEAAVASLNYSVRPTAFSRNDGTEFDSRRQHDGSSAAQAGTQPILSDRAAIHILQSVTFKARRLFLLLATSLLEEHDESDDDGDYGASELSTMSFSALADLARINFLAMTADALRALLVEFTSHGLIAITDTSVVSIAVSPADLRHVLDTFASANSSV